MSLKTLKLYAYNENMDIIGFRPPSGNEFKNRNKYERIIKKVKCLVFVPLRGISLKTVERGRRGRMAPSGPCFRPPSGNEFKNKIE